MENKDQPAFPEIFPGFVYADGSSEPPSINGGLTKREYLAGLALQGLCAYPGLQDVNAEKIAELSVTYADALLTHLSNK